MPARRAVVTEDGKTCTGCNIKLGGYEAMKKLGSKLDLYLRGDSHGTPNNR